MVKSLPPKAAKRRSKQGTRSLQMLAAISLLGAGLAAWNQFSISRDANLAAGPRSAAQERFFIEAASRPDIETFFKRLTPSRRIALAEHIGRYSDAQLPKLVCNLLLSVDIDADDALTNSLAKLAVVQPAAVAAELADKGSFQLRAVFGALHSIGAAAVPFVVDRLSTADALPNAVQFLVELGAEGKRPLVDALESRDEAVRLATADGLAKLRCSEATPRITELYASANATSREGYLEALCGIADPRSEALFSDIVADPAESGAARGQAALGLGRIASPTSVRTLWRHYSDPDSDLATTVLASLRLAGDTALNSPNAFPDGLVAVAAEVRSKRADSVLSDALAREDLRLQAARAAGGRETLVQPLASAIRAVDSRTAGDFVDAGIESLMTTASGTKAAHELSKDPSIKGFVERRRALQESQVQLGS